ncbi:MAG: sodium:proton antiporter [Candidatus Cloacimonadota bacterium]|nr:MAG: sodium:proton antiporter [Candidatus Cloacimonadota bacterium]
MKKVTGVLLLIFALLIFVNPAFSEDVSSHEKSIEKVENHKAETHKSNGSIEAKHEDNSHDTHHGAPHLDGRNLSLLWVIPFIGILLSIAIFPLVAPHFWHHHYGKVSLFWGVLFFIAFTIANGANMSFFYLIEVYLLEFIPFIALLLALFTVSGGIQLKGELIGSPKLNIIILLIGTFLASLMGTTGAAMLLIRPLIRANSWRKYRVHTVVFFIFLVANIGGSLTPIGDPPLFLGFLKGVAFDWTLTHMITPMLFAVAILLTVYFIIDTILYKKESNIPQKSPNGEKLSVSGKLNFILIVAVVGAVLLASMNFGIAFTIHHVDMPTSLLLQVTILLIITFISLKITSKDIREGNEFEWEPIREVAKLFATIFITMVPAITMLKAGVEGPLGAVIKGVKDSNGEFINSSFFWATGILSSFLDNAPTYVVFFNTAGGDASYLMNAGAQTLLAISAGAVFMGANTYIGNAPNFMVKSIAESSKIKMPSFFGYMAWSGLILVPTFILITFVFF